MGKFELYNLTTNSEGPMFVISLAIASTPDSYQHVLA
jgi:hypothetical protein